MISAFFAASVARAGMSSGQRGLANLSGEARPECAKKVAGDHRMDFITVTLSQKNIPLDRKVGQISGACDTLNVKEQKTFAEARKQAQAETDKELVADAHAAMGANARSQTIGDSPVEKDYAARVAKLKAIEDPVERMRLGYNLATAFQGKYMNDEQRSKVPTLETAGATLRHADATGFGGVCRDFSSLLTYTFQQLGTSSTGQKDFAAEVLYTPNHAVVKVRMENAGDRFGGGTFALDPTNFKEFTPLPEPDLFGSNASLEAQRDACVSVAQCLQGGGGTNGGSGGAVPAGGGAGDGAGTR